MKKFLLICLLFVFPLKVNADDTCLQATVSFNWDTITQEERDENIEQVRKFIFGDTVEKKRLKDFKEKYKDYLKDRNYKTHYMVASAGYKEYKEYNISAMFYKNMSTLYMYALQPKEDLMTIYYYDAMGNLRYVDNIKGNYPEFPYYTEQYRRSGKLAGVSYFTSKETQYIFKPDGEFKGVWNEYSFYNEKGKVIMKRSNY